MYPFWHLFDVDLQPEWGHKRPLLTRPVRLPPARWGVLPLPVPIHYSFRSVAITDPFCHFAGQWSKTPSFPAWEVGQRLFLDVDLRRNSVIPGLHSGHCEPESQMSIRKWWCFRTPLRKWADGRMDGHSGPFCVPPRVQLRCAIFFDKNLGNGQKVVKKGHKSGRKGGHKVVESGYIQGSKRVKTARSSLSSNLPTNRSNGWFVGRFHESEIWPDLVISVRSGHFLTRPRGHFSQTARQESQLH